MYNVCILARDMKKRVNISIGSELHGSAVALAVEREMDFSALVSELLRREVAKGSRGPRYSSGGNKRTRIGGKVGQVKGASAVAKGPDSGNQPRNAPCACGSGRKFKVCCGKPV